MELVRRGLASTEVEAIALIEARRVLVNGAIGLKVTRLVSPEESLAVLRLGARFVSRGGEKLEAALERFNLDVVGKRALDAGSSTGGFVDCLLQRGAVSVVAVDVGRGQLSQVLRDDVRVHVHERSNLRLISVEDVGGVPFEVLTADLSFISLTKVVGRLAGALAAPRADLVVLVKPQFECTRKEASVGKGVVYDPAVWARSLAGAALAIAAAGGVVRGSMVSPLRGADGNTEFFLHAVAHAPAAVAAGDEAAGGEAVGSGFVGVENVLGAEVAQGLTKAVEEAAELRGARSAPGSPGSMERPPPHPSPSSPSCRRWDGSPLGVEQQVRSRASVHAPIDVPLGSSRARQA